MEKRGGGSIAKIIQMEDIQFDPKTAKVKVGDTVKWVNKDDVVDVFPPRDIARYVLASPPPQQFPALERITTIPVFREDGTVLSEPGYDPVSALIYDPPKGFRVGVPESPSDEDIAAAMRPCSSKCCWKEARQRCEFEIRPTFTPRASSSSSTGVTSS